LLINPADGDFRVSPGSPCIDAGLNTAMRMRTDYVGNPRFVHGIVDIGPCEYQGPFDPPVWYVDDDAPAAGNGTSWSQAFPSLQGALGRAETGDEIRLGAGVYRPPLRNPAAAREATFVIDRDVVIRGGYAGLGAVDPDSRDIIQFQTILSGDLAENDIGLSDPCQLHFHATRRDNAYHVLTMRASAMLEGLTITGGIANLEGGGWGPIYHDRGGALYVEAGDPVLRDCFIVENAALHLGAGIHVAGNSFPSVSNCRFYQNDGDAVCGAIAQVSNCVFEHIIGSGMRLSRARPGSRIDACQFIRNYETALAICDVDPVVTVESCLFEHNHWEGAVTIDESSPLLIGCVFRENNRYSGGGGAVSLNTGSRARFSDCRFEENTAASPGGAIRCVAGAVPVFDRCHFVANHCYGTRDDEGLGGVVCCASYAAPSFRNCLFADNYATRQGGVLYGLGRAMAGFSNCTFVNNASPLGSILACADDEWGMGGQCDISIENSILDGGDPIYNENDSSIQIRYSNVCGGWAGEGNMCEMPLFVHPDQDFHLRPDSPCVDQGDNSVIEPDATDLEGNPRILNGTVDMGAYETSVPSKVIYVDDDATGADDGTSWADAFVTLQDALAVALPGDEIHVAQGRYTPDQGAGREPGDRFASFQLINNVNVIGAYAGLHGGDPEERDTGRYETILSGDLQGDDAAVTDPANLRDDPTRQDNSQMILNGSNVGASTVLDGFAISGGNALGVSDEAYGGGLYNARSSGPSLRNCTFRANAAYSGGAIYRVNPEATVANCRFVWNHAWSYGGAVVSFGDATFINCFFAGNQGRDGGAVHSDECSPVFRNCAFIGNRANCGGALHNEDTRPTVTNCTFVANHAQAGGGMYNERTAVITNCILWRNTAEFGTVQDAQIDYSHNNEPQIVSYCCVQGLDGRFEGTGNMDVPPRFVEPAGPDAVVGTADDNVRLRMDSPAVDAGDSSVIEPGATDLDGHPRVFGDTVDLGAYEMQTIRPRIWYVDASAEPGSAGRNWRSAFRYLQDALMMAVEDDEIRVAQGTYRPDQFALSDRPNLGRAESFHLRSGVAIRGGYAGLGAPDPDARDTERYETILSGDRLGDDVMLAGTEWEQVDDFVRSDSLLDNCVTVVTGVDVDASAVLDGVVVMGGNANCYDGPRGRPESVGGGMYLVSASPTMVDCVFRANMSQALWWIDCGLPAPPPDVEDEWPYFVGPRAAGGAVYIAEGGPTFHRCRFVHNVVYSGDVSAGGGALCSVEADPVLVDCTFESNVATGFDDEYYGGAICALGGRLNLQGCTFTHNQAIYSSGGALYGTAVEVVLEACTFMHNAARTSGGAMVLGEEGSSAAIRGCRFEGNQADRGGALYASAGTLDIARSAFRGNFAAYGGGAVDYWFGDLAFRNCLFARNHTSSEGGAVHAFNSRLAAVGCTFADNAADQWGGALALSHFAVISAENSIFSDNSAEEGAHIWTSDETPVWLRYSDVTGGPAGISVGRPEDLHWGPGNIDAEPLFADAVGGDFHLKSQAGRWDPTQNAWIQDEVTSPCIDAGDPATSIMHEPFPNGGLVNMGTYGGTAEASKSWFNAPVCEVIITGDINGDCRVDMGDLAIMACHWLEVQ